MAGRRHENAARLYWAAAGDAKTARLKSRAFGRAPARSRGLFFASVLHDAARCRIFARAAFCFRVWRRPPTGRPIRATLAPWRLQAVRDVEIRAIAKG